MESTELGFTCYLKPLSEALQIVSGLILLKNSASIFSNVHLQVVEKKLRLYFSSGNIDNGVSFFTEIPVTSKKDGELSIYFPDLFNLIKEINKEKKESVTFIINKSPDKKIKTCTIIVENIPYVLSANFNVYLREHNMKLGLNENVFNDVTLDVYSSSKFQSFFKSLLPMVSKSESRRYVAGINFISQEGKLILQATNGKIMAQYNCTTDNKTNKNLILPWRLCKALSRLKGEISLGFKERGYNTYAKIGNYFFMSCNMEGTYPPCEKIIETTIETPKINLNTKEFRRSFEILRNDKTYIPEQIDSVIFQNKIINKLKNKNDKEYLFNYYKLNESKKKYILNEISKDIKGDIYAKLKKENIFAKLKTIGCSYYPMLELILVGKKSEVADPSNILTVEGTWENTRYRSFVVANPNLYAVLKNIKDETVRVGCQMNKKWMEKEQKYSYSGVLSIYGEGFCILVGVSGAKKIYE